MSGKNTVSIAGEEWELQPLRGLRAFTIVPKILSLASKIIYAASRAKLDLLSIIGEDGFNFESLRAENILVFNFVCEEISGNWPMIEMEILPLIVGQPPGEKPGWLVENGSPFEIMKAIWDSLSFHAPSIFGQGTWEALKKLAAAEEQQAENQTGSTPSETSP